MVADRINSINVSSTMKISAEARRLSGEGVRIIDLSAGEPDFPSPPNVKDAAVSAINKNLTHYTLNPGITELRQAVSDKIKRENGVNYGLNEIIISSGAKQSIYNAINVLVNTGDEVLIPSPYWVSYPEMVKLAHGKAVIIETSARDRFKVFPKQLQYAITEKTKVLILCNPSNPTGMVYNKAELEALADICSQKNIFVISDEIYDKIIYEDNGYVSFAAIDSMRKKSVVINGVSKAYSMTGWRIGYAAGPEQIINGMEKIQSHSTSCPSSVSQAAAYEALTGPQDYMINMRSELMERRDYLYSELNSVKGITCLKPEGAFYLFPDVSGLFGSKTDVMKIKSSFDFAMYLLYQAGVAVVPGISFGAEGYIRISYSRSMEELKSAAERIKVAAAGLH